MKEFSSLETFEFTLNRLWLIVVLTLLGGILGWAVHFLLPPVYEAKAALIVDVNFAQTGKLSLVEQDQSIGAAMAVVGSTSVLEQAAADVAAQQISTQPLMVGHNLFVERRQAQIILRVRDRDPRRAAALANLWVERGFSALQAAQSHAFRAQSWHNILVAMQDCPGGASSKDPPPSICGVGDYDTLQQKLRSVEGAYTFEVVSSQAIQPFLSFSLSRKAAVPTRPTANQAGIFALAGALLGFIAGVSAVNLLQKRSQAGSEPQ